MMGFMKAFSLSKVSPRFWPIFGFAGLFVVMITLIVYRFWSWPGGLTAAEISAATTAGNLHPLHLTMEQVVNLPFTILQWLSIKVLGLSTFAIRLPAVVLAVLSVAGFVLITQRWFSKRYGAAAIISGLFVASMPAFLLLARSGTGTISVIFLMILVIASASEAIRCREPSVEHGKFAKYWATFCELALGLALVGLMYVPGGVYFVIGFVVLGLLHPKVRALSLRVRSWRSFVLLAVVPLILLSPLVWALASREGWDIAKALLDLNVTWSLESLKTVGLDIVNWRIGFNGLMLTPILGIAMAIVALVGLWRLARDFFSARTYLVLGLLVASLAMAASNPAFSYYLIVPLAFLLLIGAATLIDEWFTRFPRNPYARWLGTGLLAIVVSFATWSNVDQLRTSVDYNASVASAYSHEFSAVEKYISSHKDQTMQLVVAANEVDFYTILARDHTNVSVTTADSIKDDDNISTIVLTSSQHTLDGTPQYIMTSSFKENSVLARVY
jgi:4-amino-4-deoxy-L-arabinose transferase-like glycosyltransferase